MTNADINKTFVHRGTGLPVVIVSVEGVALGNQRVIYVCRRLLDGANWHSIGGYFSMPGEQFTSDFFEDRRNAERNADPRAGT